MNTKSTPWINMDFKPGWVSVIIPTYNREKVLIEAMESVYQQTYRPIELIVVDDGSTDNTKAAVAIWRNNIGDKGENFLFKYLLQKNNGAPSARNAGVLESSGEYIQFLDSDDRLHPENTHCIVKKFKETSCDYVITGFERFCNRCKKIIASHIPESSDDPLILLCKNRLLANGIQYCWKRELVNKIGPWDNRLAVYQDYDFIIRGLILSRNGEFVKRPLAYSRFGTPGPRIFDIRQTRQAYISFLRTNKKLCEGLKTLNTSQKVKKKLILKFYKKAVAVHLEYPHVGRKIGQLAYSMDRRILDIPKMIQWFSRGSEKEAMGIYLKWLHLKNKLSGYLKKEKKTMIHRCQNEVFDELPN